MSHLLWEKLAAEGEFQHNDWQPYQIDDYQDDGRNYQDSRVTDPFYVMAAMPMMAMRLKMKAITMRTEYWNIGTIH